MRGRWLVSLVGVTVTGAAAACGGATNGAADARDVGGPCIPALEDDPKFAGFDEHEITLDSYGASGDPVCLVNHFRGRVTCPYGQDGTTSTCKTPSGRTVIGDRHGWVDPQCSDRTADRTVYKSCRCANAAGRTDDGAAYCACPDAFPCTPLVSSIGAKNDTVSGSYCMKRGTAYDPSTACSSVCTPGTGSCG